MPDGNQPLGAAAQAPDVSVATAHSHYPPSIAAALHAVMASCGYVQKKGKNTFHGYKYAGEGNLLEVLRPAMVEHGLMLIPSGRTFTPIDEHGITNVEVEYTLIHKDGSVWPEKITAFGAGGDKNKTGVGDKGLYKALTGANKYLLFKLFQIETGDDPERDDERPAGKPTAQASAPTETKNPPGRHAVVSDVRLKVREINACDDADTLLAFLNTEDFKKFAFKVCCEYPNDWLGPEDNSGLSGAIAQRAQQLHSQDAAEWVYRMERARDKKLKTAKEADQ